MYVISLSKSAESEIYLRDKYGERLGYEVVSLPEKRIAKLPSKKDYIYDALEVEFLETKNNGSKASDYKGLGTELLKAAVLESKNSGYGGRIFLRAYDVKPPTPFYYKCGLRFFEDDKNKAMASYLANNAGSGLQLEESIKRGLMYLPEENIDKLLNL